MDAPGRSATVTVTMPVELVGLHWLAMTLTARHRGVPYAVSDRARDAAAAYRRIMDGLTPAVIASSPQDAVIGRHVLAVPIPAGGPPTLVYRARYIREDGGPLDGGRSEWAAPSAWALASDLQAARMPIPAGVVQWLYHARPPATMHVAEGGCIAYFEIGEKK